MSLTRAILDTILVARTGALLTTVGKDGTTVDGTNADLVDPIRSAMAVLGYSVASKSAVTDTDLASVSADDEDALIDISELKVLELVVYPGSALLVDITAGPRRENYSQFSKHIQSMIANKAKMIEENHGSSLGDDLEAGVFSISTLEDGDNVY